MNKIKIARQIIPYLSFFLLLIMLGWELHHYKSNELPSPLIGEAMPTFNLPNVIPGQPAFTNQSLRGNVALINVWATWCYACEMEYPMLMKINAQYHIPIYGIDYKDNAKDAILWLRKHGNPFILIGDDKFGNTAIDFGVYGTPETFVIDSQGKIIYRHVGIIDQQAWDNVLYPMIQELIKSKDKD